MQNQTLLDAINAPSIAECCKPGTPHPEWAGHKVRIRGTTPIYLIDPEGYRRLIPFPLTFMNLFDDKVVMEVQASTFVADIAEGPALDNGAVLVRGRCCEQIYLLDHGRKRLITSQRILEKYEFSEEAVVVAPKILIDAIPEGQVWE